MAGAKIVDTHSWHWLSVGSGEKGSCSILIKELQSDPTFFTAGQLENQQNGQQFSQFLFFSAKHTAAFISVLHFN